MAESNGIDLWKLSDLTTPWSLHVAATLRIADRIAGGTAAVEDLARESGADADALLRLLRHLVENGVFEEPAPGRFALNEAADALRDDHPSRLRFSLDLDGFGGRMANAWAGLLSAVRTGRPACDEVFGRPFWEELDAHPPIAASFDELMGPAGRGIPDPEVLVRPDWDSVRTVVDVGGGTGTLLAEVLRARPGLRGTLVDLPRVVARSGETFAAAGVADRVTTMGQSFFDPLPAGADLYLMKSVLADWPDAEAAAILHRCAEAARPRGRVVLLNGVSPDDDGTPPSPDLLMLVLVAGRQRACPSSGGWPGRPASRWRPPPGSRRVASSWSAARPEPTPVTCLNTPSTNAVPDRAKDRGPSQPPARCGPHPSGRTIGA